MKYLSCKDYCNYIGRKNVVTEMYGKSSVALYRDTNFREKRGIAWLGAGMWKLKGVRKTVDKGKWPLQLGEKAVRHILLSCLENSNWREINKQIRIG
jgi:hypothetical protein